MSTLRAWLSRILAVCSAEGSKASGWLPGGTKQSKTLPHAECPLSTSPFCPVCGHSLPVFPAATQTDSTGRPWPHLLLCLPYGVSCATAVCFSRPPKGAVHTCAVLSCCTWRWDASKGCVKREGAIGMDSGCPALTECPRWPTRFRSGAWGPVCPSALSLSSTCCSMRVCRNGTSTTPLYRAWPKLGLHHIANLLRGGSARGQSEGQGRETGTENKHRLQDPRADYSLATHTATTQVHGLSPQKPWQPHHISEPQLGWEL